MNFIFEFKYVILMVFIYWNLNRNSKTEYI